MVDSPQNDSKTPTKKTISAHDFDAVQAESSTTLDGAEHLTIKGHIRTSSIVKPIRTFALDVAEAKQKEQTTKETEKKPEPSTKPVPEKETTDTPPKKATKTSEPEPVEVTPARGSFMPQKALEVEAKISSEKTKSVEAEVTIKKPVPGTPPLQTPPAPAAPSKPKPPLPKQTDGIQSIPKQRQLEELAEQVAGSEIKDKVDDADSRAKAATTLKTLEHDTQRIIHEGGLSQVNIAAQEQRRRSERGFTPLPKEESVILKNVTLVIVSIILIVTGFSVVWFIYSKTNVLPDQAVEMNQDVIFVDRKKTIDIGALEGKALFDALEAERIRTQSASNAIVELELMTNAGLSRSEEITGSEFLSRTADAPNALTRSVLDQYMLGVHPAQENAPFLIFKTDSFDVTFASMLDWEQTIQQDLTPLFGELTDRSSGLQTGINQQEFHDVVVRNKDTRLLRNTDGNIVLMYGFSNTETVIITTNEETFFEIFQRLSTSRSSS